MVLITIVTGAYKPTYNWGASHCTKNHIVFSTENADFTERWAAPSFQPQLTWCQGWHFSPLFLKLMGREHEKSWRSGWEKLTFFHQGCHFSLFQNLMKAEARTMCCFHWAKKISWEKDRKNSAANSEWKKHLHQALKPHGREVLFPVPHTLFQITCFYTIVLSRY